MKMATTVQFEWTVTIEEDGVLIMENDVLVTAEVDGEGCVSVEDIELLKYGPTVKIPSGRYERKIDAYIPFLSSDKPWLAALALKGADVLENDWRFRQAAREDAAGAVADACADYLYDMARGA
jgi:hypothetical protein